MELLFVILGMPLMGALMLLFDSHRKGGMDRDAREFGRGALSVLGWLALLHAAGMAAWMVKGLFVPQAVPGQTVLLVILRCLVTAILWFAGWSAVKVGRQGDAEGLDLAAQSRYSAESEQLWAAELLLVGLPLVVPAAFVILMLAGIFGIYDVTASFGRSAGTNRLLWTLALAASSNRPFAAELEAMAVHERGRFYHRRLSGVARNLREGTTLATALASAPGILPRHLLTAIQTAEEAGQLAEELPALALRHSQFVDQEDVNNQLGSIAIYTWVVGMVAFCVISFICYWIIPKFKEIFNDFAVPLPPATVWLISLTDLASGYWYLILPILSLPLLLLAGLYQMTYGAVQGRSGFLLRIFPSLESAILLRTLGDSVQGNTPLTRTLELMSHLHPVYQQQARLSRVQARVAVGGPLGTALWDEGLLNARESHAVNLAERMGQLPWSLNLLADGIDRRRIERLLWILEVSRPCFVIMLGAGVLFFCLSMLTPLTELIGELS